MLTGKHGIFHSSLILIPDVDFPVGIVSEVPLVVLLPGFFLGGRCFIILHLVWIVISSSSWEPCETGGSASPSAPTPSCSPSDSLSSVSDASSSSSCSPSDSHSAWRTPPRSPPWLDRRHPPPQALPRPPPCLDRRHPLPEEPARQGAPHHSRHPHPPTSGSHSPYLRFPAAPFLH